MRYSASEKLEIIRAVEASQLPVKRTLAMLGIPSSTYYQWYARWVEGGLDALADRSPRPRSVWNRIPDEIREDVVEFALEHEVLTPRELAVKYTDEKRYFVSESSACRILKAADLITAPAHVVIRAADEFREKTTRPYELPLSSPQAATAGQRADRLHLPQGRRSRRRRAFGTVAGSTSARSSTITAVTSSPDLRRRPRDRSSWI